jgi:hypothetical protein
MTQKEKKNMHRVHPVDITCNLGKAIHAHRSAPKGTDKVHAAISNGSSDDLGSSRMM